jgi:hypothetical protein
MSRLVSPNQLQEEACAQMLAGKTPVSRRDWELCANFWACNVEAGLEEAVLPVLGMIFDCPLSREHLIAIARFQHRAKTRDERGKADRV